MGFFSAGEQRWAVCEVGEVTPLHYFIGNRRTSDSCAQHLDTLTLPIGERRDVGIGIR